MTQLEVSGGWKGGLPELAWPTAGIGRLGHVAPVVKQEEESQAALEAVSGGRVRLDDIL